MIVDTSALVAIIRDEPEAAAFMDAIRGAQARRISAATYLELAIVIDAKGDPGASLLIDELLAGLEISIEPVTASQAGIAREANRRFGRGSGGGARLNVGDCFAYALARERGEPLLFKGDDFSKTDIPFVGPREERHRLHELLAPYGT